MPRFSIIAVDYEGHVPRYGMYQGLKSLAEQTFKDFELIICHDGPRENQEEYGRVLQELGLSAKIINTPKRMNDWGHSSRDYAMRRADGEYFIQFNIDNLFYPDALEKINKKLDEVNEQIVIFQVRHHKAAGGAVFTGIPPKHCFIDAMQLVAHRKIWENIGYWYNKEGTSDGLIYEDMCNRYPWAELPECLGDNF